MRPCAASPGSAVPRDRQPAGDTALHVAPVVGSLFPGEREEVGQVLALLMAVPVLVLLVAAANAANLLLARGVDRRKELALRRALGASRARLIRQLLIECLMLTLVAGAAGVGLSRILTAVIGRGGQIPDAILESFRVDVAVFGATLVLSAMTAVLFGLVPAFVASNPALAPSLKEEGVTLAIGRRRHRLRDVLVVGQVAVSVVLLVIAGLFLASLTKALRVDPGFEARDGATLVVRSRVARVFTRRVRKRSSATCSIARAPTPRSNPPRSRPRCHWAAGCSEPRSSGPARSPTMTG